MKTDAEQAQQTEDLNGLQGWLAFFIFGQVVTGAILVWEVVLLLGIARGGTSPIVGEAVSYGLACNLLWLVAIAAGLLLIIRRSRWAPAYWVGCLVFSAFIGGLSAVALEPIRTGSARHPHRTPRRRSRGR